MLPVTLPQWQSLGIIQMTRARRKCSQKEFPLGSPIGERVWVREFLSIQSPEERCGQPGPGLARKDVNQTSQNAGNSSDASQRKSASDKGPSSVPKCLRMITSLAKYSSENSKNDLPYPFPASNQFLTVGYRDRT